MSARAPSLGVIAPRIGIVRSYPPRCEIVHENAPANHIYEVISGTVCTCKVLKNGRRQIAGFYFTGDVFGLESVARYPLAAEAITKTEIRVFKKQTLTAAASSNGEVTHHLLTLTARECARQQSLLLSLSRSAEDRIVYFIVEMIERAPPKEGRIALPMSRQDIADYLGLTIETVSRILHDLERRGAIKIKGYRSIALRNQFVEGRVDELPDLFEGIKGHQPKTRQELDEWLVSPEGRTGTIFNLTSLSGWGERARS
jgi:CRP/FNR family transcriptional regulator, nitrogen fixation regulation protein